jgi:Domain of unknown function (DUF389)
VRPVSSLIDNPNLYSLIVGVLAGIVGVVSLTEARAAALIGVFISVTTIPAAADTGLSIAYTSWAEARGSALQLLLNVAVLIAIGALGLRLQRIIWRLRRGASHRRSRPVMRAGLKGTGTAQFPPAAPVASPYWGEARLCVAVLAWYQHRCNQP